MSARWPDTVIAIIIDQRCTERRSRPLTKRITQIASGNKRVTDQFTRIIGDEEAITVKGDSLLIIEQMRGNYKVKNEGLKPLHMKARMLVMQIGNVRFEHVPRENNKDADRLSNVGMDGNGELR